MYAVSGVRNLSKLFVEPFNNVKDSCDILRPVQVDANISQLILEMRLTGGEKSRIQ